MSWGYSSTTDNAAVHAFLWTQSGGMVDLGASRWHMSVPVAISNSGQVVGCWGFLGWNNHVRSRGPKPAE